MLKQKGLYIYFQIQILNEIQALLSFRLHCFFISYLPHICVLAFNLSEGQLRFVYTNADLKINKYRPNYQPLFNFFCGGKKLWIHFWTQQTVWKWDLSLPQYIFTAFHTQINARWIYIHTQKKLLLKVTQFRLIQTNTHTFALCIRLLLLLQTRQKPANPNQA